MKKHLLSLGLLAVIGLLAISCNNSELEKRISDLERRVAGLENTSTSTSQVTPRSSAAPVVTTSNLQTTPKIDEKPDGPLPKFNFEKTLHDFGTITEGEVVSHVFSFTNNGEIPLIIESAKASCGCTVPHWPKEPIPVGGTGEIEVSFNSKGKPGAQNKNVTITANTYPKITKLNIKSVVLKGDTGGNPSK